MNNTLIPASKKYTHPFKLSYKINPDDTLSTNIRSESFLYSPPTSVGGSMSKIDIAGLDSGHNFSYNSLTGQPMYCILELQIQSLQVQSAKIVWSQDASSLKSLEFGNGMDQKAARVVLGSIVHDDKYDLESRSAQLFCVYLDQVVSSHLILANMVFNSVPVIFPVPFCGVLI